MEYANSDIVTLKKRRAEVIKQIKVTAKVCLPESTRVFIFGSQANKEFLKSADIDLGILGKKRLDYKVLADFRLMLEALPNLYTFDVVDFNATGDAFKTIAMEDIEYIDL